LLDELVADPDVLDEQQRQQRDQDDPPGAELGRSEEGRDENPLHESESRDADPEEGVDDRSPRRVLAQAAAPDWDPVLEAEALGALAERRVACGGREAHGLRIWRVGAGNPSARHGWKLAAAGPASRP